MEIKMNSIDDILARLNDLGANKLNHINGDLEKHLRGTYDLLKSWGNTNDLCFAGLYHAAYGTDGFPEQLATLDQRKVIAEIIGTQAEEIVYFYSACDRPHTYHQIINEDKPTYKDRFTGIVFTPSKTMLASFCELTFANELEIARENQQFREKYGTQLIALFKKLSGHVSVNAFSHFQEVFDVNDASYNDN